MSSEPIIMLVVADEAACLSHDPVHENVFRDAEPHRPYRESPDRLRRLLRRLRGGHQSDHGLESSRVEFEVIRSADHGIQAILDCHDEAYVDFLKRAYSEWVAQGGDARGVVLRVACHPHYRHMSDPRPSALSLDGQIGLYCWDVGHTITGDTFGAAYAAAQVALSAARWLHDVSEELEPDAVRPSIFAATRPPGHHASCSTTGGYCYINSAAVAARWLSQSSHVSSRVAIVDIDAHFGNGTCSIFYEDPNVFYTSLHADKAFPHFGGRAEDVGSGPGRGRTRNYPLPVGTSENVYLAALEDALLNVANFDPRWLIISLGTDTYIDDPLQLFRVTKAGYDTMGARFARLRLPTVIVMEGGYNIEDLPELFERFLCSFVAQGHHLSRHAQMAEESVLASSQSV